MVVAAAMALAAPASAATVDHDGLTLTYAAAAGEANVLAVSAAAQYVSYSQSVLPSSVDVRLLDVTDDGAQIAAADSDVPRCHANGGRALCLAPGVFFGGYAGPPLVGYFAVDLGDGADSVAFTSPFEVSGRVLVHGGAGADDLQGDSYVGPTELHGDDGNDRLRSADGTLDGGAGDDVIETAGGTAVCGAGDDVARIGAAASAAADCERVEPLV